MDRRGSFLVQVKFARASLRIASVYAFSPRAHAAATFCTKALRQLPSAMQGPRRRPVYLLILTVLIISQPHPAMMCLQAQILTGASWFGLEVMSDHKISAPLIHLWKYTQITTDTDSRSHIADSDAHRRVYPRAPKFQLELGEPPYHSRAEDFVRRFLPPLIVRWYRRIRRRRSAAIGG